MSKQRECRAKICGDQTICECGNAWDTNDMHPPECKGVLVGETKRIYIAGPMSGLPELNFPAFHAAAKRLREAGHVVVNPAEINCATPGDWAECMRADIKEMMTCNAVVLLPGWERSRGATLEHHIASALGFDISTY